MEKVKSLYLEKLKETKKNERGSGAIFFIGAGFFFAYVLLYGFFPITANIVHYLPIFGLLFCLLGVIEVSHHRRQYAELTELLETMTFKSSETPNFGKESKRRLFS